MSALSARIEPRGLFIDGVRIPGVLKVEMTATPASTTTVGHTMVVHIRVDRVEWTPTLAGESEPTSPLGSPPVPGGAMCGDREDNYCCRRVVGHSGSHDNGGGVSWCHD